MNTPTSATKYIVANWKSNKTTAEMTAWCAKFKPFFEQFAAQTPQVKVVLCPSFVHLAQIHYFLPQLSLGTQTLSAYPSGAYTGAVPAGMVNEYAQYAILGHVERRQFFNETDQMVTNQAIQALENNITPIVSVNDLNWSSQLSQLTDEQLARCLVMYEPPEAISTNGQNHPADLEKVDAAIQLINNSYRVKCVLYGGSVTAGTLQSYLNDELVSGVVVGNASLDAEKFIQLLKTCE
jgi:triosephosphate isomerase (TIM)